jgi:hypothetical protein
MDPSEITTAFHSHCFGGHSHRRRDIADPFVDVSEHHSRQGPSSRQRGSASALDRARAHQMPLSVAKRSIPHMPVPTSTRSRPGRRSMRSRTTAPAGSISLEWVAGSPQEPPRSVANRAGAVRQDLVRHVAGPSAEIGLDPVVRAGWRTGWQAPKRNGSVERNRECLQNRPSRYRRPTTRLTRKPRRRTAPARGFCRITRARSERLERARRTVPTVQVRARIRALARGSRSPSTFGTRQRTG